MNVPEVIIESVWEKELSTRPVVNREIVIALLDKMMEAKPPGD